VTDISSVLDERGSRYGAFADHAAITVALKDVIQNYNSRKWNRLRPSQQEALHMICHKIGRIVNGDPDYIDSWVDIVGYAQLVVKELEGINGSG
jgi:hypothetical protein